MATFSGTSTFSNRKLKRRFSSDGTSIRDSSTKPLASAPLPLRSIGPHIYQKQYTTDVSDCEEYRPLMDIGNRGRSTSSVRNIFSEWHPPTAYASLPSTPIVLSRPVSPPTPVLPLTPPVQPSQSEPIDVPFSLWDYLREELLATDFDSHQELKWERVSNFLSIPFAIEKVFLYLLSSPYMQNANDIQDHRFWVYTLF